ncbi:hypothetical protein FA15DRAFT_629023 [Coprinopsis marcescibilis]|uniref:HIG1 domain-containing protein n=1 Tax=Coprinopsis marcescibilis TaxID=230819 RepID=A0A5C3KAJ5_COPMA|nr:hypothetical protein FA15DRAFT_629023 [Coprinopsis marcescibilis]
MKLATEEQLEAHAAASRRGALEGTLVSGAVALAGSYWANRRFPAYNRLPFSLKVLGGILLAAPCLAIQAERRGLEYDKSQWEGEGSRILDHKEVSAAKRWDLMTTNQKVTEWAFRHQYSLIVGGWAGGLAVAGGIISRNKFQTYPQKIVQARMWAQGLTIGLLLVAGALTQQRRNVLSNESHRDHSWRDVIEQQERDRELEQAALKVPAGAAVAA